MFYFFILLVVSSHVIDNSQKPIDYFFSKEGSTYYIKELNEGRDYFFFDEELQVVRMKKFPEDGELYAKFLGILLVVNDYIEKGLYTGPSFYAVKKIEGIYKEVDAFVVGTNDRKIIDKLHFEGVWDLLIKSEFEEIIREDELDQSL